MALSKLNKKKQIGYALAVLIISIVIIVVIPSEQVAPSLGTRPTYASYEDPLEYWLSNSSELKNILCREQEGELLGEWGVDFDKMFRDAYNENVGCINIFNDTLVIHYVMPFKNISRDSAQSGMVVTAMASGAQPLLAGLASLPKNEGINTIAIQIYVPGFEEEEYAFTIHLWAETIYKKSPDDWNVFSPSKAIEFILDNGGKYQVEGWMLPK